MIKHDPYINGRLVLAIDVGTGTQDIFLHGYSKNVENSPQMILPSPTVIMGKQIKEVSISEYAIFLDGYTMGGGPVNMAVKEALKSGIKIFATEKAAKTINDDLDAVRLEGIEITDKEPTGNFKKLFLTDVMFEMIRKTFSFFGVDISKCELAIAIQDHGEAPKGMSNRKFRFKHLAELIKNKSLLDKIYTSSDVPGYLTRFKSVIDSSPVKTAVMDTGVAAILGALADPQVSQRRDKLIVNVGNGHTLAVTMQDNEVVGLFEHHTSSLTTDKLDSYLHKLLDGRLTNDEVFEDSGHGAYLEGDMPIDSFLAVTGPKRGLLDKSKFEPYFAVPHGDMMLAGCFGLISAYHNRFGQKGD